MYVVAFSSCYSLKKFHDSVTCAIHGEIQHLVTYIRIITLATGKNTHLTFPCLSRSMFGEQLVKINQVTQGIDILLQSVNEMI